jgi:hypothetical protein
MELTIPKPIDLLFLVQVLKQMAFLLFNKVIVFPLVKVRYSGYYVIIDECYDIQEARLDVVIDFQRMLKAFVLKY